MKFINSLLLSVLLVVVASASTNAFRAADEVRDELEAIYAKIDKAIMAKDIDTLSSLLAADYEKNEGTTKLNRADAIAEMKKNFDMVKSIESTKTTIDKIEQVEGNQIVDFTETATITVVDASGKENQVSVSSKGRDWWVKGEDGKWLCVAAEKVE